MPFLKSISEFESMTKEYAAVGKDSRLASANLKKEDYDKVRTVLGGVAFVGALAASKNIIVATGTRSLMHSAVDTALVMQSRLFDTVGKRRAKNGYDVEYNKTYSYIHSEMNTPGGMGDLVSFEIGVGDEALADSAIQLDDGYDSSVAMIVDEKFEYNGYLPKDSRVARQSFKSLDLEEFREANLALSSDPNERKRAYGNVSSDEVAIREEDYDLRLAHSHQSFMDTVDDSKDHDEFYIEVTGAPYIYHTVDNKVYPSTVRYSGDSARELLKLTHDSALRSDIGKGEVEPDILDIAYAHGHHMQESRNKKSSMTPPDMVVDERHPEAFTETRLRHQFTHLMKSFAKSAKDKFTRIKDNGLEKLGKLKPSFMKADKELDGFAEYLEADSSEVEVPQVDNEADERRRAMAMMQEYVQNSVSASKQVAAGNDKGSQFE